MYLSSYAGKRNPCLKNKNKKGRAEICENDKNNLRKSPEGARKCRLWRQRRDLFSWEARAEQVNLIKIGRFWWFLRNRKILKKFLRNYRQHVTAASRFTAGCATIFGHVRISPFFFHFYAFLCVFVLFWKNEFGIRFSLVFFHHMMKSTSDRWSKMYVFLRVSWA